jgi:hypothetical protein
LREFEYRRELYSNRRSISNRKSGSAEDVLLNTDVFLSFDPFGVLHLTLALSPEQGARFGEKKLQQNASSVKIR